MIRGKKILGALLAFTLCFSMVIPAQADDISDAKKKQQELEQQKNTAEAEKSELSSELDSIVSKMEKTQSDLTAKETEINDAETELVTAKANEDDQYQTMKLRIKYMYENGSNEFLEILMEANSIADLLNKAEYINKISKCDRELLVEYEDTRKDVENRENALKKEYAELESLQDELAGEQANVEKLLADKNIQIDNLTSEISSCSGCTGSGGSSGISFVRHKQFRRLRQYKQQCKCIGNRITYTSGTGSSDYQWLWRTCGTDCRCNNRS